MKMVKYSNIGTFPFVYSSDSQTYIVSKSGSVFGTTRISYSFFFRNWVELWIKWTGSTHRKGLVYYINVYTVSMLLFFIMLTLFLLFFYLWFRWKLYLVFLACFLLRKKKVFFGFLDFKISVKSFLQLYRCFLIL